MKHDRCIRKLKNVKNDKRGVLGLPLNLLIMVVIAAVAIGIILSWLFIMTPPLEYIVVTPDQINDAGTANQSFSVTVTAYNSKGTMSGCDVTFSGLGIDHVGKTGEDGTYTITLTPTFGPNDHSGLIDISVSNGGNTVPGSIAVNK